MTLRPSARQCGRTAGIGFAKSPPSARDGLAVALDDDECEGDFSLAYDGGFAMKRWWILLLTLGLFAPIMGCEADAEVDVDDDDARLEVDVDD